jgi:ribosomal protein S11
MNRVNLHIKILSNNIFISVLDNNNKLKKIQSMGLIGFQNRNKKIVEGFGMLILNCIHFLKERSLKINELNLLGISYFRLKAIKKIIKKIPTYYCRILEKNSYNGCRLKKKKRQRSKLKIRVRKKL